MSGKSLVEFLPDDSGHVGRLVEAASIVANRVGDRIAMIGGLAVSARIGRAHRATRDLDTVATSSSTGAPSVVELVADGPESTLGDQPNRVLVGGVEVEVIETESLPSALDDIPLTQRLFVLAHRWGFLSASPMTICVAGSGTEATLSVASGASLVAMKLHAALDRKDEVKRASDIYDIYRLISDRRAEPVASAFTTAPHDLASLVAKGLSHLFDREVDRSVRLLRVHGGTEPQHLDSSRLRAVGAPLAAELSEIPVGPTDEREIARPS